MALVETALDAGQNWLGEKFTIGTGQFGAWVDKNQDKVALNLANRMERTAESRAAVQDGFSSVPPLIRDARYGEAGSQGIQTLRAVGLTWQRWWFEHEQSAPSGQEG